MEILQIDTPWKVGNTPKAARQKRKLPPEIQERFLALTLDIAFNGPEQTGWRNYGLVVGAHDVHHCHLNTNRPRYVVVWKVIEVSRHECRITHYICNSRTNSN